MRLIDADALYERACELEAQALEYVGKIIHDDEKIEEWRKWSAILNERTAFKHDVYDAPTIDPERKWIPVTEALPEEETDVLVSVHFEGFKGKTVDLPPSDYVEIASHVDGVWSSLSDEYKVAWKKHHVVAWMPLPESYKGD